MTKRERRGPLLTGHLSTAYLLAANLWNAAVYHADNCHTSDCSVSLHYLREAAGYLHPMTPRELTDFHKWRWPL